MPIIPVAYKKFTKWALLGPKSSFFIKISSPRIKQNQDEVVGV
jgi:hypothetical protein